MNNLRVPKKQTYEEIEKEWRSYRKNYRVCNSITTIEVIEFVQKKLRELE